MWPFGTMHTEHRVSRRTRVWWIWCTGRQQGGPCLNKTPEFTALSLPHKRSNLFLQKLTQKTQEKVWMKHKADPFLPISRTITFVHNLPTPSQEPLTPGLPDVRRCFQRESQKVGFQMLTFLLFLLRSYTGISSQRSWQCAWQPPAHNVGSFQLPRAQFLNIKRQCCVEDHKTSPKSFGTKENNKHSEPAGSRGQCTKKTQKTNTNPNSLREVSMTWKY